MDWLAIIGAAMVFGFWAIMAYLVFFMFFEASEDNDDKNKDE